MDSWKNVNLHLENLLPGVITLVLIANLLSDKINPDLKKNLLLANEFIIGGIFISLAYLIGVVLVALCRILDLLSARGIRCWMLCHFAIEKKELIMITVDHKKNDKKTLTEKINEHYRDNIKKALLKTETEVAAEIGKRRERIHLLRSTLVPAMLGAWIFKCCWYWNVVLMIAFAISILLLYAYLEVAVYDETCLSVLGKSKSD